MQCYYLIRTHIYISPVVPTMTFIVNKNKNLQVHVSTQTHTLHLVAISCSLEVFPQLSLSLVTLTVEKKHRPCFVNVPHSWVFLIVFSWLDSDLHLWQKFFFFFFFSLFIFFLWERKREKERIPSRLHMHCRAHLGTRSHDARITTQAEITEIRHPGAPCRSSVTAMLGLCGLSKCPFPNTYGFPVFCFLAFEKTLASFHFPSCIHRRAAWHQCEGLVSAKAQADVFSQHWRRDGLLVCKVTWERAGRIPKQGQQWTSSLASCLCRLWTNP